MILNYILAILWLSIVPKYWRCVIPSNKTLDMHSSNLLLVVSCTSICTLLHHLLLWTRASQYWWQPSKNISCVAYRWGVVLGKFLKNFRFSSSCLSYVLYVFAYQKILQWKRQQHLQFCACMLSRSIQPVLFHGGFVLLSRKSL